MDRKVYSGVDDGICSANEWSEWNWIDVIGTELMFRSDGGVEEAVMEVLRKQ